MEGKRERDIGDCLFAHGYHHPKSPYIHHHPVVFLQRAARNWVPRQPKNWKNFTTYSDLFDETRATPAAARRGFMSRLASYSNRCPTGCNFFVWVKHAAESFGAFGFAVDATKKLALCIQQYVTRNSAAINYLCETGRGVLASNISQ